MGFRVSSACAMRSELCQPWSRMSLIAPNITSSMRLLTDANVLLYFQVIILDLKTISGTLGSNVCGEVSNAQGARMRLKIPSISAVGWHVLLTILDWPLNKRYDLNLEHAGFKDFDGKVSDDNSKYSICQVPQRLPRSTYAMDASLPSCRANLLTQWANFANSQNSRHLFQKATLERKGYGIHKVGANSKRVVCECMNDDSANGNHDDLRKMIWFISDKFVVETPVEPSCFDNHYYNSATKRCECKKQSFLSVFLIKILGIAEPNSVAETACVELTNDKNQKIFIGKISSNSAPDYHEVREI